MRVPTVRKKSGVAACSVKLPSRLTESMPATYRLWSQVIQNGTVTARAALSTPGIVCAAWCSRSRSARFSAGVNRSLRSSTSTHRMGSMS